MIQLFTYNLLFIVYLETIFHITCFKDFNILNFILSLVLTIIFTVFLTIFLTLIKNTKIRNIINNIFFILLVIIFGAELVYYKIYESFFNISGIAFAGALKDGYDKILLTIFQNIIPIILFITPIVLLFILNKKKKISINSSFNKLESMALIMLLVVSTLFSFVTINNLNKDKTYSYYNLLNKVNMPILNVKSFGFIPSSIISIERSIFGFTQESIESEDILINKKTILSDSLNIKYNIDESIDLESLASTEQNSTIKSIHEYFSNQTPTDQNKFTGMFKGKNVIFILAESFDEIAIDKDLTPTLYELKNNGIIFNNYFAPKYPASTADGEYMLEWGTLPIIGENYSLIDMVYNTNPYILPRQLKTQGYSTYVYHDYTGIYNYRKKYFSTLNFNGMKYCGEGIETECHNFHGSDMDMMDQTIDDFINEDLFFTYYITLSGHGSYDSSNYVAAKHLSKLDNYNYPSQLKYYMAANIDFDLAMNKLVTRLKEANKLDDTVIIISSDHSPYYLTNQQVNLRSSIDRDNKIDRNRGSLIIYNSGLKKKYTIDKYAMNIDVLPTVLNMLGIKYDSRIIIGKDIMATNNDGLVIFPDRSWATNYGSYDTSTGKFTKYVDTVDDKYMTKICQEVNEKYTTSVNMQYNDYYKSIFK